MSLQRHNPHHMNKDVKHPKQEGEVSAPPPSRPANQDLSLPCLNLKGSVRTFLFPGAPERHFPPSAVFRFIAAGMFLNIAAARSPIFPPLSRFLFL